MAKMSRDKEVGPDEIVIKMLSAMNDYKIDKITELISGDGQLSLFMLFVRRFFVLLRAKLHVQVM